jgi:hypothetical protein
MSKGSEFVLTAAERPAYKSALSVVRFEPMEHDMSAKGRSKQLTLHV